ncbi:MAG: AAC(3) family N-acetyltransferase, partial [Ilumatobacteraceae bacterium]
MAESESIGRTTTPATVGSLVRDLRALGVELGDVLVVHSSLNALGWVAGGAAAVVDALLESVGPAGTVTMPSHSGDWSHPEGWSNPPVPREWWDAIVHERP